MSEIIDPATNRTTRHAKLLSTVMDWTMEKRILRALCRAGVADPAGLAVLAIRVRATAETRGGQGLSEFELAGVIEDFLEHRKVRRVIAAYVATSYEGVTRMQAMKDLADLQAECRQIVREAEERAAGGIVLVGGNS